MTDGGGQPGRTVRVSLDDVVILLGLLELLSSDVDPGSDLGGLLHRTATRLSSRIDDAATRAHPPG